MKTTRIHILLGLLMAGGVTMLNNFIIVSKCFIATFRNEKTEFYDLTTLFFVAFFVPRIFFCSLL